MLVACRLAGLSAFEAITMQGSGWVAQCEADARLPSEAVRRFRPSRPRPLSCPSPVARAREETRGHAGSSERINRHLARFSGEALGRSPAPPPVVP